MAFVLPAEFGVDPLGSGARVGLLEIGVVGQQVQALTECRAAAAGRVPLIADGGVKRHGAFVQALTFGGAPLFTSIAIRGHATEAPRGTQIASISETTTDLLQSLGSGQQTIDFLAILLWIIAACIVGSVIYISVLERTRDLAVFKATGARTRSLFAAIAMEAVPLMIIAAGLAVLLARLLEGGFPFTIVTKASDIVRLVVLAVATGLIAGLIGLRRAAKTDPALAFRGGN